MRRRKLPWRTRLFIWQWAVSTYGYRKAFRLWRSGMKRKLLINSTYGKLMNRITCPRCGRTFVCHSPEKDPLKQHFDYCEGYQEYDDEQSIN